MKRVLSLLLVVLVMLTMTACAGDKESPKGNERDREKETTTTVPQSGIEKLRKYVMENGANYQGVYKSLYLEIDAVTSISCTANGDISFYYSSEDDKGDCAIEMDFFDGSVTQTVTFEYTLSGYTLTATGTLYTAIASGDDCSLYGISYREDFPSYITKSDLDEVASELFPAYTRLMLAKVNLMLVKYVGVELKDLGFDNW